MCLQYLWLLELYKMELLEKKMDELEDVMKDEWEDEIEDCYRRGQPTLVGTISVEISELLSRMLKRKNIPQTKACNRVRVTVEVDKILLVNISSIYLVKGRKFLYIYHHY